MNVKQLSLVVAERTKRPIVEAEAILRAALEVIRAEVTARRSVTLYAFGTFSAAPIGPRVGRNMATGERIDIPAQVRPRFSPTPKFMQPPASHLGRFDWRRGWTDEKSD